MANFPEYIQLLVICLVSGILVRAYVITKQSKARRPRSPPALPIIGHLHLLAPIPHQSLYKLSTRYGPIIHLFLGSVPCVIASTPETAELFLKTHETSFSNRPGSSVVDILTYGTKDFSFAPYGPYWKFMKKICMSELLGGRTLDQLFPLRRQEKVSFLKLLLKKAKSGEAVDVGGMLVRLTNNIISRMIMGQTCWKDEEVGKLVEDTMDLMGTFNVSDYIWFCKTWDLRGLKKRVKEIRESFDHGMGRVIKEHNDERRKRKENGRAAEVKDLLDILLDIHEDESSEVKLTMENIKAFIWVSASLSAKVTISATSINISNRYFLINID